jgi:TolA-binding protein
MSVAVAVCSFFIGFQYAIGAPSKINDVKFADHKDHSSVSFIADTLPELKLSFDKKSKTLAVRLISASGTEILEGFEYSDTMIDSVSTVKDKKTGDTLLKIKFKVANISFYKTSATGKPGLTLNFREVAKPMRIAGAAPEPKMASAPVEPEKKVDVVEEKVVVVEEKPTVSEEKLKRLALLDKKFGKLAKESGREKYVEIMTLFRQSKFKDIARRADRFLKRYPKSIYRQKIYFTKAESFYLMAKDKDKSAISKALEAFNEAMALYPESPHIEQALMRKGFLYTEQEFYIEAMTEYGGLLRSFPKGKYSVSAMFARSAIYMKGKKYKKAYNELEKILILFPNQREVRDVKFLIAESYYDRGKYKIANAIFKEAIKQWPTFPKSHPKTYLKIAETKRKLGNIDAAMEDFYSIVNLFPSAIEGRRAMLSIGDVYVETGRKPKAAQIFERMTVRYPKNDESILAKMRLATLGAQDPSLLKHSRIFDYSAFEKPIETFNAIISKGVDEKFGQEALLRKGRAYSTQKRYVASVIAFKQLLMTIPDARMSDEVFNLVRANFVEMIKVFYKEDGFFMVLMTYYDNFDPFLRGIKEPDILVKIADSYSEMTLYNRALEYYRMVNKFDDKKELLSYAAFKIADTTLQKGEYKKAERLFTLYLSQFQQESYVVTARHLLGDTISKLDRPAQAATQWRIAIESDIEHPRVSETAYRLANGFKESRQYMMAIDSYNLAIDAYKPRGANSDGKRLIKDSYYQLAESYYLDRDYPNAIREASDVKTSYPDDERNVWMDYIMSSSYEKINMDEMAMASLKNISESDSASTVGKVASSRLSNFEWKRKNPDLFID